MIFLPFSNYFVSRSSFLPTKGVEINSAFAPPPLIFRSFDLLKFSFLLMTFRMSAAAGGANAAGNQRA